MRAQTSTEMSSGPTTRIRTQGGLTMEIVLIFASILLAIALGGESVLGMLTVFAVCQIIGSVLCIAASCGRKYI